VLSLTANDLAQLLLLQGPFAALLERLAALESQVNALTGEAMPTMKETIDRVRAEVTEARTVADSAKALVTQLAQQIRDNIGDPAALNALADQLDATNADLAAAVQANTPA
jgi:TolA-binding protein